MLRLFLAVIGLATALPGLAQTSGDLARPAEAAGPQDAFSRETRIWQQLQMGALMPILQDEALAEADAMQDSLSGRGGDGRWMRQVGAIHDPARLESLFRAALDRALADVPARLIDAALDFYATSLGGRLIGLETSARQVMLDPDAEAEARARFDDAVSQEVPRASQILRLIDAADLIAANVAGGLNASLAFSKGFAEAGGYPMPMTEAEILSEIWAQEDDIHTDTRDWMQAYLYLAYSPLSDVELERYIVFAGSSEGKALTRVLFAGFDALYRQTSHDMGIAVAGQLEGREL